VFFLLAPASTLYSENLPSLQQKLKALKDGREQKLKELKEERKIRKMTKGAKRISAFEAYQLYKTGKALLISVDYPGNYKDRHIVGSINISHDKIVFQKLRLKIKKSTPILLYCR